MTISSKVTIIFWIWLLVLSNKVTIRIWIGFCWCNHWWNDQNEIMIGPSIPPIIIRRLYLDKQSILMLSPENSLHCNDSFLICGYDSKKNHDSNRIIFVGIFRNYLMWVRVSGSRWDRYFSNLVLFLGFPSLQSIYTWLKLLLCIIIYLLDLLVPNLNYSLFQMIDTLKLIQFVLLIFK